MDILIRDVYTSALQTLSLLSKTRCVDNYYHLVENKTKYLHSWPVELEKNKEVLRFLDNVGIRPDKYSVKSLPVNYSEYKDMGKIGVSTLFDIRASRDIVTANLIANMPSDRVKIYMYIDEGDELEVTLPEETSDHQKMAKVSKCRGVMYGFSHPDVKFKYKVPAYVGEFLFKDIGLFPNAVICRRERSDAVGKEADELGRAKRYVVHKGNLNHLSNVLSATEKSICTLTKTVPWAQDLRRLGVDFHSKK